MWVNCPVLHTIPAHLWVHHTSPLVVELNRFKFPQYNYLSTVHVASNKKSLIINILGHQTGIQIIQMVEKLRDLSWSSFPLIPDSLKFRDLLLIKG